MLYSRKLALKNLKVNKRSFYASTRLLEARKLTVREAIREAIDDEIVRDSNVFLMGEVSLANFIFCNFHIRLFL